MENLHNKLHLDLLCNRRKMFMLKMMYKLSCDVENVNMYRPDITLRTGPKVKMKIDFTDKQRVYKSPYYLCNQLWEKIGVSVQLSRDIYEFKRNLKTVDLSVL